MLNKWIDYLIRLVLVTLAIIWFFMLYSDNSLLVLLGIILLIDTTLYLLTKERSDLSSNIKHVNKKFLKELHLKK